MINQIIDWSVRHRRALILAIVALSIYGGWQMCRLPLDAFPELGETQVIVCARWDRSADILESQVTYPIVTALLGAPKIKSVRGVTDFGYAYIYVTYQDNTDLYWARSRTQEYLAGVLSKLPEGVSTELGSDATALGWVYQYILQPTDARHNLDELRKCQEWYLKYHLKSVSGVAEVATVGGVQRQYQVNVKPDLLAQYGISITQVVDAVRAGNQESSGRVIEFGGSEYMVRGRGGINSLSDVEAMPLRSNQGKTVRIGDVANVEYGPDIRRGVADLNGNGEVVSGIVIARPGQNNLEVIKRIKEKIRQISPGLPEGVRVVPVYDRSGLINQAVASAIQSLLEIVLMVVLVVFVFLRHFPSAVIPALTIPVAALICFIPFHFLGLSANIMSLGGLAIAVGAMVDASIIMVEQVHKNLEKNGGQVCGGHVQTVLHSVKQVARPAFFSALIIAVSFLPILMLEEQEGHLFKPLACAKTVAMLVAAVLVLTFDPALRITFAGWHDQIRAKTRNRFLLGLFVGKVRKEEDDCLMRGLIAGYNRVLAAAFKHKLWVFLGASLAILSCVPVFQRLGTEYMPPLDEGALLYMPSTSPHISISESTRLLQVTDSILSGFPEVRCVLGKAGRADSPTDPAPISMLETLVVLKPKNEWRTMETWYSRWSPDWLKVVLRRFSPDHITQEALIAEMNQSLNLPGVANGWTMPIKGRIEMLNSGMKVPLGIKITAPDHARLEKLGQSIESALEKMEVTRSVFAERTQEGRYLDIEWDRIALAAHGLTIAEAQASVANAIGGENITTVLVGRERYALNVRYQRAFRDDEAKISQVYVSSSDGRVQVRLEEVARLIKRSGPTMIRDEDGALTGYIYVDTRNTDLGGYVSQADELIRREVVLEEGTAYFWSGQYLAMKRVRQSLYAIIPLTVALIFLLLHMSTRSWFKTLFVLLAVPFSAIGAIWGLWLLDYHVSVPVWVGIIALLGIDAETGVFMLTYLDLAIDKASSENRLKNRTELRSAIGEGAVQRLRPKLMTVAAMVAGLLPIMWSDGAASELMQRVAAPLLGGILTSFALELLIYPLVYETWVLNFSRRNLIQNEA